MVVEAQVAEADGVWGTFDRVRDGLFDIAFEKSKLLQTRYKNRTGETMNLPEFDAWFDRLNRFLLCIQNDSIDFLLPL